MSVPPDLAAEVVRRQSSGVVVQDDAGNIVGHNPAALVVLQMTADQLAGRSSLDPTWQAVDAELRPLAGEDHPAMRALSTGRPVRDAVMGVRVGDGAYRWLRVNSWPLDQTPRRVVTQFDDITNELNVHAQMAEALSRLQDHALPGPPPLASWLRADSRYQSMNGPLDIGGDFLDVFAIDDQRLGFFVGDACGHDLTTITTMVVARHTLRAAGLHFQRPGQVLRWLDDLLRSTADTVFCTAVYGTVTPAVDHGVDILLANAGHPAPIHVSRSAATSITLHGALVGALHTFVEPPTAEVHLAPDERLVIYTDGLLDSFRPRLDHDSLVERLEGAHVGGPVDPLVLVDELLGRAAGEGRTTRDDMAVLVLTATGVG